MKMEGWSKLFKQLKSLTNAAGEIVYETENYSSRDRKNASLEMHWISKIPEKAKTIELETIPKCDIDVLFNEILDDKTTVFSCATNSFNTETNGLIRDYYEYNDLTQYGKNIGY